MTVSQIARNTLRGLVRKAGYDFIPVRRSNKDMFSAFMRSQNITRVIDVGANVGQFAQGLRADGFAGEIYCFEPLSSAHDALSRWAAKDPRTHVFARSAVGAEPGRVSINVSKNSVSSSILPIEASHTDACANSAYVATEDVNVVTLDQFRNTFEKLGERLLLKIDTQGFESHVLDGASDLLAACHAVYLELSFTPLYAGQVLWDGIAQRLLAAGFELWNITPNFFDEAIGRVLQADALFVRKDQP